MPSKYPFKKAKIVLRLSKMSVTQLISFAYGIEKGLTGNTQLPNPPVTPAQLHTLALTLENTHIQRQTTQSKALTQQEKEQSSDVMLALEKIAAYVESVANETAKGDMAVAESIIASAGFTSKKAADRHVKAFEVQKSGHGWIQVSVKKSRKGAEAHKWQYGYTSQIGTPPTTTQTIETLESTIILQGLESGKIVGIRHSSILPVSKGTSSKFTKADAAKSIQNATHIPISKTRHPVITDGSTEELYQWSEWLYVVVG